MAEEVKNPPAFDAAEVLKNTKAEFDRKTANLEASNKQLQDQILALTQQMKPAPKNEPIKKVSVFEDEDAFAARISSETEARINKNIEAQNEKNRRMQTVSTQLVADYPELADKSSPLMKKADELFRALPDDERAHPYAMKLAVQEAAAELDMKPFSKRTRADQEDPDTFQIGGGSGAAVNKKKGPRDLSAEQETLAQLLGIDISKPETRERIKEKHGRGSYGRFK